MKAVKDWYSNRDDVRVRAALAVTCCLCKAAPGANCIWPIGPRLIHEIRVPIDVLHRKETV